MKTRLGLLIPALAALAACRVDNNGSLRIEAICAPPDAATCTFAATCDAQSIGRTVIDVSQTTELFLQVQVNNLMPDNGRRDINRTNTNDAVVQEIDVEYEGVALPPATERVLGSALVPAAGTSVISIVPIPSAAGAALGAMGIPATTGRLSFIAKVKLKGQFADTTKFETGAFEIPVTACNACVGTITCVAPQIPKYCPAPGQEPATAKCVTP